MKSFIPIKYCISTLLLVSSLLSAQKKETYHHDLYPVWSPDRNTAFPGSKLLSLNPLETPWSNSQKTLNGQSTVSQKNLPEILSVRIKNLQKSLKENEANAEENFWKEVTTDGTPLVEKIESDQNYRYVTFLLKANPDTLTSCVVKFWSTVFFAHPYFIKAGQLMNLPSTNVWFKTIKFRKDLRVSYQFSINDPLTRLINFEAGDRLKNFIPDPLNPKRYAALQGESSVLELDGAPLQPWIRKIAGVPEGTIINKTFESKILQNKREIWIYLPHGYDKTKTYPLITFLDGRANGISAGMPASTILDNIISEKLISPCIALFIGEVPGTNPMATRVTEFLYNDSFSNFVARELIPLLRKEYHASIKPNENVIAGASLGGNAATFIAFRNPTIFGNVISQSAGFMSPEKRKAFPTLEEGGYLEYNFPEHEWLTRQIVLSKKLSIRFYLSVGLLEDVSAYLEPPIFAYPSLLQSTRHLHDVLQAKGYDCYYNEYNGGHEWLNWQGFLPDGLIRFLSIK